MHTGLYLHRRWDSEACDYGLVDLSLKQKCVLPALTAWLHLIFYLTNTPNEKLQQKHERLLHVNVPDRETNFNIRQT